MINFVGCLESFIFNVLINFYLKIYNPKITCITFRTFLSDDDNELSS